MSIYTHPKGTSWYYREMGSRNKKTGKLSYTDNSITWMGEEHEREKGMIKFEGQWLPEGSTEFPWEQH